MAEMDALFNQIYLRVAELMSRYDGSHDMTHIKRVMRNAEIVMESEQRSSSAYTYDVALVRFGALMHDVGDNKYALPGEDVTRMVYDMIMLAVDHAPEHHTFATKVQAIATGVSYTAELANPDKVKDLIKEIPELAIVQDADRLDAIGATGIGRSYMYSGAHDLPLQAARALIDSRLCLYKERMKTKTGRHMAETKTKRLELFREWWDEECGA